MLRDVIFRPASVDSHCEFRDDFNGWKFPSLSHTFRIVKPYNKQILPSWSIPRTLEGKGGKDIASFFLII